MKKPKSGTVIKDVAVPFEVGQKLNISGQPYEIVKVGQVDHTTGGIMLDVKPTRKPRPIAEGMTRLKPDRQWCLVCGRQFKLQENGWTPRHKRANGSICSGSGC